MTTENTWADGDVATAAKLNNLEDTVIVQCTSTTRPTGAEGRVIYETDTNKFMSYDGSAWQIMGGDKWTSFTPSWTGLTIGNAVQTWAYRYVPGGMMVTGDTVFGTTSSFTSTSFKIEVPNSESAAYASIGSCLLFESGVRNWIGIAAAVTTTIAFTHTESGNAGNVNSTNPFTFASADRVYGTIFIPL